MQTYAASYFKDIEVRIGDTPIPPGTNVVTQNSRCANQQQGANPHSVVTFLCPPPGLKGNTISLQHNSERIYVVEAEVLGNVY